MVKIMQLFDTNKQYQKLFINLQLMQKSTKWNKNIFSEKLNKASEFEKFFHWYIDFSGRQWIKISFYN